MYVLKFSHATQDFKIKSKADVKTFLEEVFHSGEAVLKVSKDHCFFIRKKNYNDDIIIVSEKYGDLYNPFNPELRLDEETAISRLYTFRKYINLAMLGD